MPQVTRACNPHCAHLLQPNLRPVHNAVNNRLRKQSCCHVIRKMVLSDRWHPGRMNKEAQPPIARFHTRRHHIFRKIIDAYQRKDILQRRKYRTSSGSKLAGGRNSSSSSTSSTTVWRCSAAPRSYNAHHLQRTLAGDAYIQNQHLQSANVSANAGVNAGTASSDTNTTSSHSMCWNDSNSSSTAARAGAAAAEAGLQLL